MKRLIFLILFTSCIFHLPGQTVDSYSITAEFFPEDARMYNLPVSPQNFMRATALIEISDIDEAEMVFYLHGELGIDSIRAAGQKIEYKAEKVLYDYSYSLLALKVSFNTRDVAPGNELQVHYSGFINHSRARSLSDYMQINKNSGVFLRAYGYSLWFPVFTESGQGSYQSDFKSVAINLPEEFKCVVAGELVDERVENGIYHAEWKPGKMDISDIQCVAQKYRVVSEDNVFVYFVSDINSAEKILHYARQLKKLYSDNLRPINESVPLYITEMPRYGDISSGNVVGVSGKNFNSFDDGQISKLTIAHELVHPYVKIPVTIDNPFYAFVIEGFPSFFQAWALAKVDGGNYNIEEVMRRLESSYREKRRTGLTSRGNKLPPEKAILDIPHHEIGNYKDKFVLRDRVWLFFYDMWQQTGDEKFDAFLKELFVFQTINYNSFETLVLKYLPDYKFRLKQWLRTTEFPEELRLVK